jgi:hypothetical protein
MRISILSLLLCGCASISRTVPPTDEYEYRDSSGKAYHYTLSEGVISGVSSLVATTGDTLESLRWKFETAVLPKEGWKSVQYFRTDTLFAANPIRESEEGCKLSKDNEVRSPKDTRAVMARDWPQMGSVYRKYLKTHWFGGQIIIRFAIRPDGQIENMYLTGNTSGDHDFALAILGMAEKWKFKEIRSGCLQRISQTFDFRP